ncbi:glycosyltransferase, partial [Sporolactobacillus kofuensis]
EALPTPLRYSLTTFILKSVEYLVIVKPPKVEFCRPTLGGQFIVLSTDGGFVKEESFIKYKIKKYFISSATLWLSSGKLANEYLLHYGANPNKLYMYPFSSMRDSEISRKPISITEKNNYKKMLGISEKKMILGVGQIIHRKGWDILLNACKGLDENIGVYIVGGSVTEECLEIQNSLGLKHIYFVPFMSKTELEKYYKAADLFALPTREDVWGLVINEAMSYGLPVISTNKCGAAVEMVREGQSGYIIDCDDYKVLNNYIIDVLKKNALSGKQTEIIDIVRQYTIERMVEKTYSILSEDY